MMSQYELSLKWIEDQQTSMEALVEKWCNINSGSDHLSGLASFLNVLREDFSILEGRENLISLPPRKVIGPQGLLIEKPLGQALSIRKRPRAPLQVLLAGHLDTVYGASNPFQHVERLDAQTMRGPGVIDMKGGLVILLKILEAFEKSPYKEAIGWEILINPDEEIGSPGSADLFRDSAQRHDIGLIFEPGFGDGAFVSKRKGSANLALIARGRSAHAGRDFYAGRNSIYALARLIGEIERLNFNDKGVTLNVGHIEGGGPVNIVPDLAICRLNIRSSTKEDLLDTKEAIYNIIKDTSLDGIQIEMIEEFCRLPKPFDEAHQALFKQYERCAQELNMPFILRESGGACDGNILAEEGLPTLDSLGAIGGLLHTDEEYLLVSSLKERAKLTLLFLLKLASGEIQLDKRESHG